MTQTAVATQPDRACSALKRTHTHAQIDSDTHTLLSTDRERGFSQRYPEGRHRVPDPNDKDVHIRETFFLSLKCP
jgi:hypothetical protein